MKQKAHSAKTWLTAKFTAQGHRKAGYRFL